MPPDERMPKHHLLSLIWWHRRYISVIVTLPPLRRCQGFGSGGRAVEGLGGLLEGLRQLQGTGVEREDRLGVGDPVLVLLPDDGLRHREVQTGAGAGSRDVGVAEHAHTDFPERLENVPRLGGVGLVEQVRRVELAVLRHEGAGGVLALTGADAGPGAVVADAELTDHVEAQAVRVLGDQVPHCAFAQEVSTLLLTQLVVGLLALVVVAHRALRDALVLATVLGLLLQGLEAAVRHLAEHGEGALGADVGPQRVGVQDLAGVAVTPLDLFQFCVGTVLAAAALDLLEDAVVRVLGEAVLVDLLVDLEGVEVLDRLEVLGEVVPLFVVLGVDDDRAPGVGHRTTEVHDVVGLALQEDALERLVDVGVAGAVHQTGARGGERAGGVERQPGLGTLVEVLDHVHRHVGGAQDALVAALLGVVHPPAGTQ